MSTVAMVISIKSVDRAIVILLRCQFLHWYATGIHKFYLFFALVNLEYE